MSLGIKAPWGMSQVAALICNVKVGTTVGKPGSLWGGKCVSEYASACTGSGDTTSCFQTTSCGPITASDMQAAIWAFIQDEKECDGFGSVVVCTYTLPAQPVSLCNVAWLYDYALRAAPRGKLYECSRGHGKKGKGKWGKGGHDYSHIPYVVQATPPPSSPSQAMITVFSACELCPACCATSSTPGPHTSLPLRGPHTSD